MKKKYIAFSLIEIMVVVSLIAILASLSVYSYREYVIKTKVKRAYDIVQGITDHLIAEYHLNGRTWPTAITYGGVTINDGAWTAFNVDPVVAVHWDEWSSTASHNRIRVLANVSGLAGMVSGYVDPTPNPTTSFAYSMIDSVTKEEGEGFKFYCGSWALNDPTQVPIKYLPAGCNCDMVDAAYNADAVDCSRF